MAKILRAKPSFRTLQNTHFAQSARLLAQVGFASWPAIAKLGEEDRKFHREDHRKAHKCSALELSLIEDISSFYENGKPRTSSPKERREPPYEELVIHQSMGRWGVGLIELAGFPIPDQDKENIFSKKFYEASKKEPPYTSFAIPKIRGKPRPARRLSRERAGRFRMGTIAHKGRSHSNMLACKRGPCMSFVSS